MDANPHRGGFDNKPLAHVQFAGALTSAAAASLASADALRVAADLVAAEQRGDGSWPLDPLQSVGIAHDVRHRRGHVARAATLVAAATTALQPAIERADRCCGPPRDNIPDTAAVVLALERSPDYDAISSAPARSRCSFADRRPMAGGARSPRPLPTFDTAIVCSRSPPIDDTLARPAFKDATGRRPSHATPFLIEQQVPDGTGPKRRALRTRKLRAADFDDRWATPRCWRANLTPSQQRHASFVFRVCFGVPSS